VSNPTLDTREIPEEINNIRQLIDCRVALKVADLRGNVREIPDCVIAFLVVGRRRWEGLQIAVIHTGCQPSVTLDMARPIPDHVLALVRGLFEGTHFHSEQIDLDDITKVRIGRPAELGEPDYSVAFLECNGVHPFNHFPGEPCPIHYGDEPSSPSVAGWGVEEQTGDGDG
jgi:hypothetical protein